MALVGCASAPKQQVSTGWGNGVNVVTAPALSPSPAPQQVWTTNALNPNVWQQVPASAPQQGVQTQPQVVYVQPAPQVVYVPVYDTQRSYSSYSGASWGVSYRTGGYYSGGYYSPSGYRNKTVHIHKTVVKGPKCPPPQHHHGGRGGHGGRK